MVILFCRSEHALLQVVSGRGIVSGGRADFEVHPGDQLVIPSSPDYVIINNGTETLHLEPAHEQVNDTTNSKKQ